MVGSDISVPVFIPPRKRQTTKKSNGTQNYVDHIVSVCVHENYILLYVVMFIIFSVAQNSHQLYPVPMIL